MFAFQLIWNSFDIKLLQYFSEKEWEIFERDNVYYIETPYTNYTSITEDWIQSHVTNRISILNGIARLQYNDHENVQVGCFCEFLADGTILANLKVKDKISWKSRMTATLSFVWETRSQISDVEKYRIIAEKNKTVGDVLHFYENPDWWNLYKIYELIKNDTGWKDAFSGYTKKISNFSWTANNYSNIWDNARHSHAESNKAMTNPITLLESQELWREIIQKWITSKINSSK